jgi:hypothetical protein
MDFVNNISSLVYGFCRESSRSVVEKNALNRSKKPAGGYPRA